MSKSVEFQVRTIDAFGDTVNVNTYDSKGEALDDAAWWLQRDAEMFGALAVAVESRTCDIDGEVEYETIVEYGDVSALSMFRGEAAL